MNLFFGSQSDNNLNVEQYCILDQKILAMTKKDARKKKVRVKKKKKVEAKATKKKKRAKAKVAKKKKRIEIKAMA